MFTTLQTAVIILSLAVYTTVGLNCSVEDCSEKQDCPPDSELVDGWSCSCVKDKCSQPPDCHYKSKRVLKHKASGVPGNCCDIYECVYHAEVNCTDVICPTIEEECPSDSYRLPNTQEEGECCSKPMGCACFPATCHPLVCPKGKVHKMVRPGNGKPGTCCPLYQCYPQANLSCSHNGKVVDSGTKWKKTECIECTCNNGFIHCVPAVICPELPTDCPATRLPPGECCPLCIFNHNEIELASPIVKPGGCKSIKGVIYKNGASWQEDDCTTCTCVDGARKCQAEMCHITCSNATYVSGECCPRCYGVPSTAVVENCTNLNNCTLECKHGYEKDDKGCSVCKCREEEECHLKCESGFLIDGSGTEICECAEECPPLAECNKKCKHGYKVNKEGCEVCKCEHCKPISFCNKKCPHGLQANQRGCPLCKCKAPEASNKSSSSDENECVTDAGIKRDNGEAWNDNCRQCYCLNGKEMCSLISCPKLNCPDPVFLKHSCCPICPGNVTEQGSEILCYGPGGIKQDLENWKQGCLECVCHNGSVLCHSKPCPPVLCQKPLQGDCCPVCPKEGSPINTKLDPEQSCGDRTAGEKWRQSECTSCICINGEAVCYTQTCDQIDTTCKRPVQLKNLCCPVCLDNLGNDKICQVGNVTFNIGDEWEPEKCTRCACGPAHTISCTQTICERQCSKADNPCCPKCTEIEEGYDWIHGPIYLFLVGIFMFGIGALSAILWKHCQLRRHQLKICQPSPLSYHYKYVPAYENSTPSPHKSPV